MNTRRLSVPDRWLGLCPPLTKGQRAYSGHLESRKLLLGRLEQFDGIARGVVDEDLLAAYPRHDVVAKSGA